MIKQLNGGRNLQLPNQTIVFPFETLINRLVGFSTCFYIGVPVCVNYESDGNDTANSTTLGIFTCPLLDEEPRSYTQCCGDEYAEYCCERTAKK